MASRVKEEEKNERIIRGLLKQQENRRCINCNSLGPQYVCISFWTFVCTTCSGIHREFTHRVKSVSMAKFTSQEVTALQEGGNQRAKEIYFKEWDPQRGSFPESSNVERLRDFIKHVYVDRRFSGGRNNDKPPRGKMGDKEDLYENRADGYRGGSRSPPYEDTYERRFGERSSPGGRNDDKNSRYGYDERRSPGYDQDSRQYSDYRKSPARPEVVNDWRREDRFGNGRKPEDHRVSDGDPKLEGRSPERPNDLGSSSPPVARPVREILGENVIPLRISEPPKANGIRTIDGPPTQRTASSSSLGSTSGNPAEQTTVSLIDFDADPEPPVASTVSQVQQTTVTQSGVQPTSSTNDLNWASFDFASQTNVSQAHSNVNTLDSVFSQLSVPASVPGNQSGVYSSVSGQIPAPLANVNGASLGGNSNIAFTGQIQTLPFGTAAPAPVSHFSTLPPTGALTAAPGLMPTMPVSSGSSQVDVYNAGQWPNMQQQQTSFFSGAGGQSTTQHFIPPADAASTNQPWNFAPSQHMLGPLSASVAQIPQAVSKPTQDATSTVALQTPAETKESGRRELPSDLFASTYPSYPAVIPRWQTGLPNGTGFAMQYNTGVPMSSFPQSSSSINPFDLVSEAPPVQNQTFPSMASLQGALPNAPPSSGLAHTSSLGTPSSAWMSPQSLPYASGMSLQSLPYASSVPQGPYPGAQSPNNLPISRLSATPQPFSSVGGNPFG